MSTRLGSWWLRVPSGGDPGSCWMKDHEIVVDIFLLLRCSTAKAFLRPARSRPNLHIALHSQVLKILVDSKTTAAYGVRVRRGDAVYTVLARKEVILSAGALNTPQLLMLSGIGPAEHLAEKGIYLYRDLPVGQNLQDHYGTGALTFTVDMPISAVQTRFENIPSILKYAVFGTGPLTVLGGVEVSYRDTWLVKTYFGFAGFGMDSYKIHQQKPRLS